MEDNLYEIEETYTPKEIQQILNIKQKKCYEFLEDVKENSKLFIVKRIGKLYRIPKFSFDTWFHNKD